VYADCVGPSFAIEQPVQRTEEEEEAMFLENVWQRLRGRKRSAESRPIYPAEVPKGELERGLDERLGSRRGGQPLGASDVGQDASSGGEYIETDPTRFKS
jgi:hypothetical protein